MTQSLDTPLDADFRWHRGDHQKYTGLSLWRHWEGSNGYMIWQGRPFEDDPRRFVYRLQLPNGQTEDYRLLNDAKRRGRHLHLLGFRSAASPTPEEG